MALILTLMSLYLMVKRTTMGRQPMMMHWRTSRIVLSTQLRLAMQGLESRQLSQPGAHFRHWKESSKSYSLSSPCK